MSRWGVFRALDQLHVMPCEKDGAPVNGHEPHRDCWCRPQRDPLEPALILHRDPERGGYNA